MKTKAMLFVHNPHLFHLPCPAPGSSTQQEEERGPAKANAESQCLRRAPQRHRQRRGYNRQAMCVCARRAPPSLSHLAKRGTTASSSHGLGARLSLHPMHRRIARNQDRQREQITSEEGGTLGWVLMGVANGHSNSNDADVLVERTQTTLVPTLSSDGCLHFAESCSMHRNKR